MIVTSNKPFSGWGEIFGDEVVAAAMIDRLVHHAEILSLKGDSYRLRDKDVNGPPAPGAGARIAAHRAPRRPEARNLIAQRRSQPFPGRATSWDIPETGPSGPSPRRAASLGERRGPAAEGVSFRPLTTLGRFQGVVVAYPAIRRLRDRPFDDQRASR